ncbi:tRNA uridine-5-carboxymethylaminomethyl(34) synthesis GTPase MnmE [Eubacterium oxidoreducens]|uniref:tRNA modification GTPase MnmE n=1 Tax=Eubacterium oxidoreducens TaxID=1732 RepID=A0A1G6CPS3_EUBOX|nr:tRNA uridine-5-carboxymethylaminomethyl(34) synthesis GTPase MnmE [Eubacterium oxidoreducens]SDB34877.1 tRNA modification GTPase [Eubacterium oxidoreducens]
MFQNDTIAAIATGMTNSGIGIIRISGEGAFDVIDRIYQSKKGKKVLSEQPSHTVHYGMIVDGDHIIDEVLVLMMKGPNSYTAEDTVEIDTHGGSYVMQRILDTVIKNGARLAQPGEFTKRAFLNGRIDLSQAESVMDVISAKNEFALSNSVNHLQGALYEKIKNLREMILHETAFIESALDDPEHYSLDSYPQQLSLIVDKLINNTQKLIKTAANGKILSEGITTVIVGKPNAGKSSLLNALIGEEKAIVTDIAGTTRDVLEQQLRLDGLILNLIDTAGIRQTVDTVEKIGVDRAIASVDKADLIIFLVDGSIPLEEEDIKILEYIKDKKVICILNKSDLDFVVSKEDILKYLDAPVISISAKKQEGIDSLSSYIKDMFIRKEIDYNDEVFITNARHEQALRDTLSSLELVKSSIEQNMPEDFFSIDLMNAYDSLGNIIGESTSEDLVDEIFSKFCMGK